MEYPFKDLMPLDEATARDGYYKDWTHIDADTFHQISELAKFIREKGYGADTREAIAQALERVYHDAAMSGNANMEVSMARKHFKDLASRLDASDDKLTSTTAQLTQKASKNNLLIEETERKNADENIQTQVNNLVLGAVGDGNNAELVQARGVYDLLYERLDSVDEDLKSILKIKNQITDGGFTDGINRWTPAFAATTTVTNGVLSVIGNGTTPTPRSSYHKNTSNGMYYVKFKLRVTNSKCENLLLLNPVGSIIDTITPTPTANQWYDYSTVIPINNNLSEFVISHRYASPNDALNSVMEVDEVLVINLTEIFGQERELSKEDMDNFIDVIGGWFNDEVIVSDSHQLQYILDKMGDSSDVSLIADKVNTIEDKIYSLENPLPAYAIADLQSVNTKVVNTHKEDSISFAFITDTHARGSGANSQFEEIKNHLSSVVRLSEYGNLDFICLGGDIIDGYESDKEDGKNMLNELTRILNKSKVPVFALRGNHDDNSYYTTGLPLASNVITSNEFYRAMIRPYKNNSVHDVNQLVTSTYHYTDFDDKKVRVIVLDSSDYAIRLDGEGRLIDNGRNWHGFGIRQIEWLATEALVNIPAGYKIIVLCHIPTKFELSGFEVKNRFLVDNLLLACHNGDTYTGSSDNDPYSTSVNVDYTSQGARQVLAFMHGHTHFDNIQKPSNLGWNFISVPNSYGIQTTSGMETIAGATSPLRVKGTDTEDCWDVVSIRPSTGTINCIRYGAGDDRVASL